MMIVLIAGDIFAILYFREQMTMPENSLVCATREWGGLPGQWGEAKNANKHSIMHETVLHGKVVSSLGC